MQPFQKLKMSTDFENRIQVIDRINDVPVVFFKESEKPTLEENILLWRRIEEISIESPVYFIIDVSKASPPSAEIRAYTKKHMNTFKDNILHSYVVTGSNLFLKIGLKFILASMGLKCFSVVKTNADALSLIRNNV